MQYVKALMTTELGNHLKPASYSVIKLSSHFLQAYFPVHAWIQSPRCTSACLLECLGNQIYHERKLNRKSDLLHSYAHLSAVVKKPKMSNSEKPLSFSTLEGG